jgi:hypothetical protein
VAGLLLDRVDHGLDAFSNDHRLHLRHRLASFAGPKKKTPGAQPLRPRCLFFAAFLGGEKGAP